MKPSISTEKSRFSVSLVSGVLLILLFPPFNLHFLAWVALVPLMAATVGSAPHRAMSYGFVAGLVYFGGVMPWIGNVLTVYGNIGAPLAFLLMLLLYAYLALYMAVFTFTLARMGKGSESLLYAPFLFVVLEYLRGHLLSGLPWALLAHSQHAVPPMIQIASFTGTAGVTFLIVLVNATLAHSVLKWRAGRHPVALPLAAVALVVLNAAWGTAEIDRIVAEGGGTLKVSLIQGNVEQDRKWDPDYRDEVMERYFLLTEAAARENPDLIVWPETAIPFFFKVDMELTEAVQMLAKKNGAWLLFGGMGMERTAAGRSYFNRAYMVSPGGGEWNYDKQHLVPFGEYVPFRRWLTFVDRITDAVAGDIVPGTVIKPGLVDGVSTGAQVCYEIIFAEPSRAFRREGALFMVNITNDAWFGKYAASAQHMMSLPFRAVENRIPVVRAANTGISGFVTATGEMRNLTGLFATTHVTDTVLLPPERMTFYTRFGDLFTLMCAGALLLAFGLFRRYRIGPFGEPERKGEG